MSKKKFLYIFIVLLLIIFTCLYNAYYINPKQLSVRQEIIKTNKIDSSLDGMTVAYFSDINYSDLIDEDLLNKLKEKIELYNPDILIFGGDLLNSSISPKQETDLANYFKSLDSKHGKFAILGEKDNDQAKSILNKGGFTILDNHSQSIYIKKNNAINITGINSDNIDTNKAFENARTNLFTLVVSHKPDSFNELPLEKCDYVLAGHSLGGQVYIPIINYFYRDEGSKNYYHGKNSKNNTTLDITNGIGYLDKKVRFLADSELVIYKFTYLP